MAGRLLLSGTVFAFVLAFVTSGLAQGPVVIAVNNVEVETGTDVEIPITIEGADGIVGMHLEILYDPAIFEYQDMQRGELFPSGAAIEINASTPGRIIAGFASIDEVIGSGELLLPVFNVSSNAGQATVGLDNVEAWNTDSFDILIESQTGTITITSETGFPIWLGFVITGLLVLLVIVIGLIILLIRRAVQGRQPASVPLDVTRPPPTSSSAPIPSEPHTMIISAPESQPQTASPQVSEIDQTQELPMPPNLEQPGPPTVTSQDQPTIQQLPEQPDQHMASTCPNCGESTAPDAENCTNCGYRLA